MDVLSSVPISLRVWQPAMFSNTLEVMHLNVNVIYVDVDYIDHLIVIQSSFIIFPHTHTHTHTQNA